MRFSALRRLICYSLRRDELRKGCTSRYLIRSEDGTTQTAWTLVPVDNKNRGDMRNRRLQARNSIQHFQIDTRASQAGHFRRLLSARRNFRPHSAWCCATWRSGVDEVENPLFPDSPHGKSIKIGSISLLPGTAIPQVPGPNASPQINPFQFD